MRLQDKKELFFLSTIHSAEASRDKNGKEGELVVNQDYNKYMSGVDKKEAIIGTYSSCRKTLKWTTKVVIHMIGSHAKCFHFVQQKHSWKKDVIFKI